LADFIFGRFFRFTVGSAFAAQVFEPGLAPASSWPHLARQKMKCRRLQQGKAFFIFMGDNRRGFGRMGGAQHGAALESPAFCN
jgi:hypothetical protein